MRIFLFVLVLCLLAAGGAWIHAGGAPGPVLEISGPEAVGQIGDVTVAVESPGANLNRLQIALVQGTNTTPLFDSAVGGPTGASIDAGAGIAIEGEDRVLVTRSIGKRAIPSLAAGQAEIQVTAVRPVLFGFREATSTLSATVEVKLIPPQVSVFSLHHFINQGGSEVVVYRVNPPDSDSGVRVGEIEYPGFPASGAGITGADPALRVAFFALLPSQDVSVPIQVFARDPIGNEGTGSFDFRVFPKQFRDSRIDVDDKFLSRVVPAILQNTPEFVVENPSDLVGSYLRINRDLRKLNNEKIASLALESSPEILWRGPFKQLLNTAVEAGFADQRTYVYNGQDIDHQVHLGFDLASTMAAPVKSANRGKVVFAGWLGIYGNCVIVDHGMGLQSLYAHLSSIGVEVGQTVELDAELGRSGATGLAGGDHLHFTMLLGGNAVTPIDWWSEQWVQDRVIRKFIEAGAPVEGEAAPTEGAARGGLGVAAEAAL
jgi:murein DD-endopeptidase MepM/ murein hydrolase activator NlpD